MYYRKKNCSLRTSNSRQWFRNVKKLDEGSDALEVDDIKSFCDEQQAELIADS